MIHEKKESLQTIKKELEDCHRLLEQKNIQWYNIRDELEMIAPDLFTSLRCEYPKLFMFSFVHFLEVRGQPFLQACPWFLQSDHHSCLCSELSIR